MSAAADNSSPRLVRGLGLLDASMIVVGSMIGSGIFITSAESARLVASPGWLLMAWALAGLLTITGVAFARFMGVLAPQVSESNYIVAPVHLFGSYAISLSTAQLVAIILILLLTATNTRGLKTVKFIQNTFTLTKTVALAGLILVGLLLGWNSHSAAYTSSWWHPAANGWNPQMVQPVLTATGTSALLMLLGLAMVGPLFAQSAWNNVTFTGSEIRDPGRNLPRALLIGCLAVVALYLLANVAYIVTLPLATIQKPPNSVATATMQGNVYTQLLEYIVSADLVFYALMVGAVIVMRRKSPALERPYRTFGYPVAPLIYISLALLLVIDLALLKAQTSGIGYLLVLTGIPIYFIWRRRSER